MSPVLGAGHLRLLGFGLLIAAFVAGALTGAAVDRVLSADEAERDGRRGDRDRDRRAYVIEEIEMTAAQRAEIDGILERRSTRMRSIWHEVAPRMDAITDSARMEIMEVLTPEQRAEYERRLEARVEAREARRQEGDGAADQGEKRDGSGDGR